MEDYRRRAHPFCMQDVSIMQTHEDSAMQQARLKYCRLTLHPQPPKRRHYQHDTTKAFSNQPKKVSNGGLLAPLYTKQALPQSPLLEFTCPSRQHSKQRHHRAHYLSIQNFIDVAIVFLYLDAKLCRFAPAETQYLTTGKRRHDVRCPQ